MDRYTIFTKSNKFMPASQFDLRADKIRVDDAEFEWEYNFVNRLFVIGNELGAICAVWGANKKSALCSAADHNLMDCVWLAEADIQLPRDIRFVTKVIEGRITQQDTLDFN